MSNQEPDGWATTSPEGEYTGNDDEIILSRIAPTANMVKEFLDDNYRTFPVCLISPQELTRLRLIAEWAKEAQELLGYPFFSEDNDLLSISLQNKYIAITAPVEDK